MAAAIRQRFGGLCKRIASTSTAYISNYLQYQGSQCNCSQPNRNLKPWFNQRILNIYPNDGVGVRTPNTSLIHLIR
ncbi:hypothetical protein MTR_7g078705 [Medicago truncatula]|uniref:Uncharacterized protein n=1 Tax=Medicago truncatula TaxID=3880 RepID=A0A072U1W9_MEDTR|nr:hypothetical protein MTR_7g078705 [Medicago truncatula]